LALASSNFGKFSNDLLGGQLRRPAGSTPLIQTPPGRRAGGTLRDVNGDPLVLTQGHPTKGFGVLSSAAAAPRVVPDTLYFTSGVNDEPMVCLQD